MIFSSSTSLYISPTFMILVFSGLMLSPNFADPFYVLPVSSLIPFQEFSSRAISSAKSCMSPLTHLIMIPYSFPLITPRIHPIRHQGKDQQLQDTSLPHSCDDLKPFPTSPPRLTAQCAHLYCHHGSSE